MIVLTSFNSHSFVYNVIYHFCGDNVLRWTPPVKSMIWTLTLLQHLTRPAEGQPNSRSSLQDTGKVKMLGNVLPVTLVDIQHFNKKYFSPATIHMMALMTTLNWSYPSLLESISMYMEIWMMMASMKVILEFQQF